MALDLTTEQKEVGRRNFEEVSGSVNRRTFLGTAAGAAVALPLSAGVYFGSTRRKRASRSRRR